jgi:magnesium transporter
MIKTTVLDTESDTFSSLRDPAEIDGALAAPNNVVWVDVLDPTDADFARLAEELGFHPLSLEDCRTAHQRPKIEEYKGYYFIVLYEVEVLPDSASIELRELNIFLGSNFLVTVHSRPLRVLESTARLWPQWVDQGKTRGPGLLAYLAIDGIVDDYFPLLDAMSDRIDDLEDSIFGDFRPETIEEIFRLKKQLLFLRRSTAPLRDVFNTLLRREQPIVPREIHVYFQDIFDHLVRVIDTIDTLRDILGSVMDAYLSVSGNRMNMVMKRLTTISTILMSVTLVAGIYGMNFDVMPELKWRFGYVWALGSMIAIGVGVYLYFRKIKWL